MVFVRSTSRAGSAEVPVLRFSAGRVQALSLAGLTKEAAGSAMHRADLGRLRRRHPVAEGWRGSSVM